MSLFKLYYSNVEVKELNWPISEFNKLVAIGDIRRPQAYKLILKVLCFKFTIKG